MVTAVELTIVEGDLLDQPTEAIVNAWNRNIIPWWLLLPQGVSGAIKRRAGLQPFQELARFGPLALGRAVHTSAGLLPHRAIIHVAGINMLWRATPRSIEDSVRNAISLAEQLGLRSIAFPLIGAGSGSFNAGEAERIMLDTFARLDSRIEVVLVRFARPTRQTK
jgi:O-acetyl-ADP-ribose deacetylase (regulator of RNase III)